MLLFADFHTVNLLFVQTIAAKLKTQQFYRKGQKKVCDFANRESRLDKDRY